MSTSISSQHYCPGHYRRPVIAFARCSASTNSSLSYGWDPKCEIRLLNGQHTGLKNRKLGATDHVRSRWATIMLLELTGTFYSMLETTSLTHKNCLEFRLYGNISISTIYICGTNIIFTPADRHIAEAAFDKGEFVQLSPASAERHRGGHRDRTHRCQYGGGFQILVVTFLNCLRLLAHRR